MFLYVLLDEALLEEVACEVNRQLRAAQGGVGIQGVATYLRNER